MRLYNYILQNISSIVLIAFIQNIYPIHPNRSASRKQVFFANSLNWMKWRIFVLISDVVCNVNMAGYGYVMVC